MNRFSNAAKVGLLAIATIVAGFYAYRYISKSATGGDGYTVYVKLKDATGIAKHSQVKMAGIPVGNVDSIKLDDGMARIDIKMNPDVPLYEDSAVAKTSSSLLGEYFLALSQGTEGRRQLEDGDRIPTVIEATTTDQILKDVGEITKDIKKVTDSLAKSIGTEQGRDDIKLTLKNLQEATDTLNKTLKENRDTIRRILLNVEGVTTTGGPKVDKILSDVSAVTGELRKLTTGQKDPEDPKSAGEIRQIITKVNRASTSLESALANVDEVSGRLARGEGTLGRLTKDEKLIDEVEGVAEGIGEIVGGISRTQTIVGLRTDYQFLASTVKTYAELRLQPREDKYYMIQIVSDPRGLTRFEQIDVDSTNPNDPPHYREVRTITSNDIRFSVQFAQLFGPFTGRFGIMESTGGVGLDLRLFDNKFEVQQDLFGFGETLRPRWRVSLGYQFISRLYLLGGVDEILSPDRRDYFIGLNLRFNDEDLKAILPFAPTP